MAAKGRSFNSDIMTRLMSTPPENISSHEESGNSAPEADANETSLDIGKIVLLPLEQIDPFKGHIFSVRDNDREMRVLMASIKEDGQQQPVVVRKKENGRYELISGHRRCRALELLGEKAVKAIISPIQNDALAELVMIETNASTREIPPCERGEMYKRRINILKELCREDDLSLWERAVIMQEEEDYSRRSIYNYISLTKLNPEWKVLVDSDTIAMTCGMNIAELKEEEQRQLYEDMNGNYAMSVTQSKRIRDLCKAVGYDQKEILNILCRGDRPVRVVNKISFKRDEIPACYSHYNSPNDVKSAIIKDGTSWRTLVDNLGDEFEGKTNEEMLTEIIKKLTT